MPRLILLLRGCSCVWLSLRVRVSSLDSKRGARWAHVMEMSVNVAKRPNACVEIRSLCNRSQSVRWLKENRFKVSGARRYDLCQHASP